MSHKEKDELVGFDALSVNLGDEAAIMLGDICVNLMTTLKAFVLQTTAYSGDQESHIDDSSSQFQDLEDVWTRILSICELILVSIAVIWPLFASTILLCI